MLAQRGQVLVIFAMAIFVLIGMVGIVIDISWYWSNSLRVQRAADAAALAGAVNLPSKPVAAVTDALNQANKNGYALTTGCNGTLPSGLNKMCAYQDAGNPNQLDVSISAPVGTFFMRVFGIQTITATRTANAQFTLPVPMGSPENYYGVFGPVRGATFTGTTISNTGFDPPTNVDSGTPVWTGATNIDNKTTADNTTYATSTTTNGSQQGWRQWNFGIPAGATIVGIQALLNAKLSAATTFTNCTIGVQLSQNGTNWWPTIPTPTTGLSTAEATYTLGSPANTTLWAGHAWVQGDFSNNATTGFHARLTWNRGGCAAAETVMVDTFTVQVTYSVTTQTTTTPATAVAGDGHDLKGPGTLCSAKSTGAPSDCFQPDGATLNARGFWGAMNTKGIQASDGDAYQSAKDFGGTVNAPSCSAISGLRNCYDPTNYYNYAIEMPAGSTGGYVYVFDPVFCDTASDQGTGDGHSSGSLDPANPPSSWYELFDANNTLYSLSDDTLLVTSGSKFVDMPYSDTTMGGMGSPAQECKQTSTAYPDERVYHDNWYLLNPGNPLSGGATGHIYRLHTTNSTPPGQSDSIDQMQVKTEQNFSLYAKATGGTPNIYGLGAMEMYTPISGAGTSQFYLAQVPAFYAGKTLELNLWDAGDTGGLAAKLYVMVPTSTAGVWTPINFNYKAQSPAPGCSASSGTNVGFVSTNTFNACWLTVDVVIPSTYSAPQNGWWQIWYAMTGSGSSSDTTTWTAHILGNPVHLVVP